jgi:hypothetical protein
MELKEGKFTEPKLAGVLLTFGYLVKRKVKSWPKIYQQCFKHYSTTLSLAGGYTVPVTEG